MGQPGAFLYILRNPNFSAEDVRKSDRDAKAPAYQLKNHSFSPHRSTSEGNVVFDDEIAIEQAEDWARRKAFLLRNELEPGKDFETFFVKDSEFRKVCSFRPDPTLQPVLSKSQKRKQRKLAKNKTLGEGTQTDSSVGARPL